MWHIIATSPCCTFRIFIRKAFYILGTLYFRSCLSSCTNWCMDCCYGEFRYSHSNAWWMFIFQYCWLRSNIRTSRYGVRQNPQSVLNTFYIWQKNNFVYCWAFVLYIGLFIVCSRQRFQLKHILLSIGNIYKYTLFNWFYNDIKSWYAKS